MNIIIIIIIIHYYKLLYVLVYQVRGSPDNLQSLHHTSPYIAVDHLSPGMGSYTVSSPPFSGGGMGVQQGEVGGREEVVREPH